MGTSLQALVLRLVSCVTLDHPVPYPLFKGSTSFVRMWSSSTRILSSRKQALKDQTQMTVLMLCVLTPVPWSCNFLLAGWILIPPFPRWWELNSGLCSCWASALHLSPITQAFASEAPGQTGVMSRGARINRYSPGGLAPSISLLVLLSKLMK